MASFSGIATFGIFYLMTVFVAGWSIQHLSFTEEDFLIVQLYSIFFFAIFIPISALLADKYTPKLIMSLASLFIVLFGLFLEPLISIQDFGVLLILSIGMALMGFTYGPLGTVLSNMFPVKIRYTGASLSFNLAGILGASFAPFIALWLANNYGFQYVGYYLSIMGMLSLIASALSDSQQKEAMN